MEFQIKDYKYHKIKQYFKNSNFFLIYNSVNTKHFIKMNQKLEKLNLDHYKIYNALTKKALKRSIYKNFHSLMNNLIIVVKPSEKSTDLKFKNFLELDECLYVIGLKLNNTVYPVSKINNYLQLNYKNDQLLLLKFLKTRLKILYKLT